MPTDCQKVEKPGFAESWPVPPPSFAVRTVPARDSSHDGNCRMWELLHLAYLTLFRLYSLYFALPIQGTIV
jgi:hypothetical protein